MTISESPSAVLTCPKCAKANQPLMRFCELCGTPLQANVKAPVNRATAAAARIAATSTAKNIRSARIALGVVAVVTLLFSLFMHIRFSNQIAEARANPQMTVNEAVVSQQYMLFTVNYLVVAIYVGLMFWTRKNPFAACLTGLVIYLTSILINAAIDPTTIVQGIIMKVIIIMALINGVKAGLAYRRQMADQPHAA